MSTENGQQVDRTKLPLPDRAFGGTIGRTKDQAVPDWQIVATNQPREGAPNILVVLIDDDAAHARPVREGLFRTDEILS